MDRMLENTLFMEEGKETNQIPSLQSMSLTRGTMTLSETT